MHTRRMSTFLLGAWIGGSLLMCYIAIQNFRSPNLVMNTSMTPVLKVIQTLGRDQTQLLLRHFAAEQDRHYFLVWERMQVGLALMLGVCLVMATQRRILPLVLCAVMLAMVLFELSISPEIAYRGRETDFPPGNNALGPVTRLWALQQVYAGVEIVKLLAGALLAGYLFVFRISRRGRKDVDSVDHADHGHVNR